MKYNLIHRPVNRESAGRHTNRTNATFLQFTFLLFSVNLFIYLFITFKNDKNQRREKEREKNVLFCAMNFADVFFFASFISSCSSFDLLRLLLQLLHCMFRSCVPFSLSLSRSLARVRLPRLSVYKNTYIWVILVRRTFT